MLIKIESLKTYYQKDPHYICKLVDFNKTIGHETIVVDSFFLSTSNINFLLKKVRYMFQILKNIYDNYTFKKSCSFHTDVSEKAR